LVKKDLYDREKKVFFFKSLHSKGQTLINSNKYLIAVFLGKGLSGFTRYVK